MKRLAGLVFVPAQASLGLGEGRAGVGVDGFVAMGGTTGSPPHEDRGWRSQGWDLDQASKHKAGMFAA